MDNKTESTGGVGIIQSPVNPDLLRSPPPRRRRVLFVVLLFFALICFFLLAGNLETTGAAFDFPERLLWPRIETNRIESVARVGAFLSSPSRRSIARSEFLGLLFWRRATTAGDVGE